MPNSNFFANCFSLIRGWYTLGNRIMNSFYRLAQTIVAIKINKIKQYLMSFFYKTIIPLALVGYGMLKANSTLRASLIIIHFLVSNASSWNNF